MALVKMSTAAVNSQANAFADALDGGSIEVYTVGSGIPATADTAITDQVLLGVATLGTPAFGDAVNGVVTANAITDDASANATGNASFYRTKTSGGAVLEQGTCGISGSGAALILNRIDITSGGTLGISSYTHAVPKE